MLSKFSPLSKKNGQTSALDGQYHYQVGQNISQTEGTSY